MAACEKVKIKRHNIFFRFCGQSTDIFNLPIILSSVT